MVNQCCYRWFKCAARGSSTEMIQTICWTELCSEIAWCLRHLICNLLECLLSHFFDGQICLEIAVLITFWFISGVDLQSASKVEHSHCLRALWAYGCPIESDWVRESQNSDFLIAKHGSDCEAVGEVQTLDQTLHGILVDFLDGLQHRFFLLEFSPSLHTSLLAQAVNVPHQFCSFCALDSQGVCQSDAFYPILS